MKKNIYILLLLILFSSTIFAKGSMHGYVFVDTNMNGIMDEGEKGIEGVLISDQERIVKTDIDGRYEIETKDNSFVYVVKPENYTFSSQRENNWNFYADVSLCNGNYNFALRPKNVAVSFDVLMVGDPQMRGEKPLHAFRNDIVTEMLNYDVDFACILGDIADNDLSIYPQEKDIIKQLPYPVFHLFGNHDVDVKASAALYASDVFKKAYGPDYYSFNEGKVHFVVLNNVLYDGWNEKENKTGNYFGGLTDVQYNWLKADLEYVDKDKLIVILSHIPFLTEYSYPKEVERFFALLQERTHLLALSGHLHYIQNYFFDKNTLWNSPYPFQGITIGAACGGWWTGPMDERGLPVSTCVDGSPNGYYKFRFEGNKYKYEFIPANHRPDFQMRITLSSDTLYSDRLEEEYFSINVFTATDKATVEVSFDDMAELLAANYTGKDLFMLRTYNHRYNFDNWQPKIENTNHLWKINIPKGLSSGNHTIKVKATDVDGNIYTGYKIFEIKK